MGPETVAAWLGAPRFHDEEIPARTRRPGVVLGLAATPEGGGRRSDVLPGRGLLRVTGTVGAVTRESADVALTWVRSHADRLARVAAKFDDANAVHVHMAEAVRSRTARPQGSSLPPPWSRRWPDSRCGATSL